MIRSEIILVPVSFFTQINAECIRVKINVSTSRNIRLLRLIGVEDGNETCFCPMDTNPEIKIKLQARVCQVTVLPITDATNRECRLIFPW